MKTYGMIESDGEVRGIMCGDCVKQFGLTPKEIVEIDQCDPVKVCDVCGQRILATWRLNILDKLLRSSMSSDEKKQLDDFIEGY